MTALLDLESEFGARMARRLRDDTTAWLTSTDRAGTPQPAPVWFLWEASTSTALLYSQPTAKRLDRTRANPRASLHLNDNGGRDFLVLTGTLAEAPDAPPVDRNAPYLEKYGQRMIEVFGSADRFAAAFSVPFVFRADHARGQ